MHYFLSCLNTTLIYSYPCVPRLNLAILVCLLAPGSWPGPGLSLPCYDPLTNPKPRTPSRRLKCRIKLLRVAMPLPTHIQGVACVSLSRCIRGGVSEVDDKCSIVQGHSASSTNHCVVQLSFRDHRALGIVIQTDVIISPTTSSYLPLITYPMIKALLPLILFPCFHMALCLTV